MKSETNLPLIMVVTGVCSSGCGVIFNESFWDVHGEGGAIAFDGTFSDADERHPDPQPDVSVDNIDADARPAYVDAGAEDVRSSEANDASNEGMFLDNGVAPPLAQEPTLSAITLAGTPWPRGDVQVCWEAATARRLDFENLRSHVMVEVQRKLSKSSRLYFWNWSQCSDPQDELIVAFDLPADGALSAPVTDIGYHPLGASNTVLRIPLPLGEQPAETVLLHQFMHAIGFGDAPEAFDGGDARFGEDATPATSDSATIADSANLIEEVTTRPGQLGCWGERVRTGHFAATDLNSIMSSSACARGAELTPWDVIGIQSVYGPKAPGLIVSYDGYCLDVPNGEYHPGAEVGFWDCHGHPNQQFEFTRRGAFTPLYDFAYELNVRTGSSPSATLVDAEEPVMGAQRWSLHPIQIVGIGDMCLKRVSGALVLGTCDDTASWSLHDDTTLELSAANELDGGTGSCLTRAGGGSSGLLQLSVCDGRTEQRFNRTARGQLERGGYCLEARPTERQVRGLLALGESMDIALVECDDAPLVDLRQHWHFRGRFQARDAAQSNCLDTDVQPTSPSSHLQLSPCTDRPSQGWDVYFTE